MLLVLTWAAIGRADLPAAVRPSIRPAAATVPASQPHVVNFQPGVRINWTCRQVEVDATVILRRGPIELFACAPGIREHESIVRIEARPLHLYQALGLIGLTPGHPIRFNPQTQELEAARGEPVEILVRYARGGTTRVEPIERWMQTAEIDQPADQARQPLDALPWVFAGSVPVEGGAIAADFEGTVIAVVNFGSALIALPEFHSDRTAELWLEPAPDRIPPEQTPCTLIFRPGPLRLALDATGRVRRADKTLTLAAVGRVVREFRPAGPHRRIRVTIDPDCPAHSEAALLRLLKSLGVPAEATTIIRPGAPSTFKHDPQALAAWIERQLFAAGAANGPELGWPEPPRQLAGDLRDRSLTLRARTESVIQYASQLARDLRHFVSPPPNPPHPTPAEP